MSAVEIRPLLPSDERLEISRIYEESWKSAYKDIVPQEYLNSIPAGRWAESLDTPGRESLVLLENGRAVGTSSFCASRFAEMEGFGEIVSIYLLPEYVHRGLGRALLRAAVDRLSDMGYKDIFLWVLEENLAARRFYERFGFKKSAAFLDDNIGGRALREIQYCCHAEKTADNT